MRQLTEHFNAEEFVCRCGRCYYSDPEELPVDIEMVKVLELIRKSIGGPITITSGFRCVRHNKRMHGAVRSDHLSGEAVDVVAPDLEKLVRTALNFMAVKYVELHNRYVHISFGKRNRRTRFVDKRGIE